MIGIPSSNASRLLARPWVSTRPINDLDRVLLRHLLLRRLQHRVGLADTGRHPEENLELAPRSRGLVALHARQNFIWI